MYLIINTSLSDKLEIILAKTKDDFKLKTMPGERKQSEKLLSGIASFLAVNRISLDKIKGIGVVSGPGGFTSIRIGVTVANTMAFALGVPLLSIKSPEFDGQKELVAKVLLKLKNAKVGGVVEPFYDREPNITPAKKKASIV